MRCLLLLLMSACLFGCTQHTYQRSAMDDIGWAEQMIAYHRIGKAYLIEMHPYETAVEAALSADPRVAAARFAFPVGWYGGSSSMHGLSRPYDVVVETVEPMAADAAAELLVQALQSAGLHPASEPRIAVEGNRWTVRWGRAAVGPEENPDITVLSAP